MRTITLSDHTKNMADQAAEKRENAFRSQLRAHEESKRARQEKRQERRAQLLTAWREKSFTSVVASAVAILFGRLPPVQAAPVSQGAGRDEVVWAKGGEGEQRVAAFLKHHLGDEWTLVSGYKNAKGEIDQLLVGPTGVYAIEIKYVNGTVHCNGSSWWRDKSDKYGNIVETNIPIADKRGRSPSQQLNEATDQLQAFLDRNFGKGYIRRAVILSHDMSKCGQLTNTGVDVVATLGSFDIWGFLGRDAVLDKTAVSSIVDVIKKDHAHYESKRGQRA